MIIRKIIIRQSWDSISKYRGYIISVCSLRLIAVRKIENHLPHISKLPPPPKPRKRQNQESTMQRDNLPRHYPREHYNSKGKTKKAYTTKEEAEKDIKRKRLKTYRAYVCSACSYWHIGRCKD